MMPVPPIPPRPDGPRKAALHMRKGEAIHRVASTPWAEYQGAPLCWRVVSKKRLDGRIEAMHFIARKEASDLVSAHVVLPEAKYADFLSKIEEAIQQFAPGLKIRSGELSEFDHVEFGPYFIHDPEAEERLRKKGLLPPETRPK
jgi:hypothetical protein